MIAAYVLVSPNHVKSCMDIIIIFAFISPDFEWFLIIHLGNNEVEISLPDLLKFVTGAFTIPPLGLGDPIEIIFLHGCKEGCRCRPTVPTCLLQLSLPVHINTFDLMKEILVSAVKDGRGFWNP